MRGLFAARVGMALPWSGFDFTQRLLFYRLSPQLMRRAVKTIPSGRPDRAIADQAGAVKACYAR
jgi:hypothetical protein